MFLTLSLARSNKEESDYYIVVEVGRILMFLAKYKGSVFRD